MYGKIHIQNVAGKITVEKQSYLNILFIDVDVEEFSISI